MLEDQSDLKGLDMVQVLDIRTHIRPRPKGVYLLKRIKEKK